MKILLVDCYSKPEAHHYFNAIAAKAIAGSPTVSWIGYCAERKQSMAVADLLQQQIAQPFVVYSSDEKKLKHLTGISLGFRMVKRYRFVYEIIRREQPERIIFLAVDYTLWPILISLFLQVIQRHFSCQVYAVLHDLYPIINNRAKHLIWRRLFARTRIRSIILAPTVAEKFQIAFPKAQYSVWHLPSYLDLYDSGMASKKESLLHEPRKRLVKILLAGRQAAYSLYSGFADFVFRESARVYDTTGCMFHIYVLAPEAPNFSSSVDNVIWKKSGLPSDEYQQLLSEMDFIIFPLESAKEYEYRASSLLADAITFLIPIIAPKSGIFEHMCAQTVNPVGWLYSSYKDLSQIFDHISVLESHRHQEMQMSLSSLRAQLSIDHTSPVLWKIIEI